MLPLQNPFFYPYNYYNKTFNKYLYKNYSSPTDQRILRRRQYQSINQHNEINNQEKNSYDINHKFTDEEKDSSTINVEKNENRNKKDTSNDNYFFELFGLKLYFDDILLIVLIFFLYQEGVRDDELFISLILLLLS